MIKKGDPFFIVELGQINKFIAVQDTEYVYGTDIPLRITGISEETLKTKKDCRRLGYFYSFQPQEVFTSEDEAKLVLAMQSL